jgi:hypothetical protein
MINIKSKKLDSGGEKFSFAFSVILIIAYSLFYIAITSFIFMKRKIFKEDVYQRIKNLVSDLDLTKIKKIYSYYLIYMLRRSLLIIIIFALRDQLVLQLMLF